MAYEYRFDMNKCPYASVCSSFGIPEECYSGCIRYMEMDYLMWSAQVPNLSKFLKPLTPNRCDIQAFQQLKVIKDNIVDFVLSGDNLYLFSENYGNGKTTWSVKLLMAFLNKVWCGNGFKPRALFLHTPTFLKKLKDRISKVDYDFDEVLKNVEKVDLVVWDDIGSTSISSYDYANILSFIEQRKFSGKSNIYTGNLNGQELEDKIDKRLRSKVFNDSCVIEFKGVDRRSD